MRSAITGLWIVSLLLLPAAASAGEETLEFGRFGSVTLYSRSEHPGRVALFVSGDGGWNQGVVDMARELAGMDALVAGIDITHYLRQLEASTEKCSYPAADFENLSQFVQKKLDFPRYLKPILIGYSSGATLVYAILVQAPPTTFKGGISLGFCPDLPLVKPMCKGSGLEWHAGPKGKGVVFEPSATLEVPWIALQGTIDQVCDPPSTQSFVRRVRGAEVVMLPKVGHGYSVPRNWLPQFRDAFARLAARADSTEPAAAAVESLRDLPLVEVPAAGDPATGTFALELTGDGGYGVTDKGIATGLAAHGIPVAVLESQHYFWNARAPAETAADVGRIVRHYLEAWKAERVILIGYSHGADVLPFAVNGLPADLRKRIQSVVLLGPGSAADFEFHWSDLLIDHHRSTSLPVGPELEKLRGLPVLCIYGTEDSETICRGADSTLVRSIPIHSGHRFGSDYEPIVEEILRSTR